VRVRVKFTAKLRADKSRSYITGEHIPCWIRGSVTTKCPVLCVLTFGSSETNTTFRKKAQVQLQSRNNRRA
jgi:hypothetical protein